MAQTELGLLMMAFDDAIGNLAQSRGVDAREALEDEHVRWLLYQDSARESGGRSVLYEALKYETNLPLVSAVVVYVLEVVNDEERLMWVMLLPPGPLRSFAAKRSEELRLEGFLARGHVSAITEGDIRGWSQWLQLRLAERTNDGEVLIRLSDFGATKRIRRVAQQRLEALG